MDSTYAEKGEAAPHAMIRRKLILETVTSVLEEAGIVRPEVDVRFIAQRKGALVIEDPLKGNDFSGFLMRIPGSPPVIGVNANHPTTRKRFTIAHEIGHLCLHAKSGVHLDQYVVKMRDSISSEGTDEQEIEANLFAAELLMPRNFIEADLKEMDNLHLDDEEIVGSLAKRYNVSSQAMTIRLSSLGYICM